MAHVGQEGTLGTVRRLCRFLGDGQAGGAFLDQCFQMMSVPLQFGGGIFSWLMSTQNPM
jgi:hypothetical protein